MTPSIHWVTDHSPITYTDPPSPSYGLLSLAQFTLSSSCDVSQQYQQFWTRGLGSVHKMNPEFLINPERWRRCLPKTLHFSWNIFANFLSNCRRKCERTQDFHMFQNINNLLFSFQTKYSAARTWFQNVKLKKMTPGCPTSGYLPLNLNCYRMFTKFWKYNIIIIYWFM